MSIPTGGKVTFLASLASDLDVVNAAKVSFQNKSYRMGEHEIGLIKYLMKNRHGTPFEHGYFRFHVEAPIFVFREWHRHRVGFSYNEASARYTELPEKSYEPQKVRSQKGKPGAYTFEEQDDYEIDCQIDGMINYKDTVFGLIRTSQQDSFRAYRTLLEAGVAKEQARAVLPVGTFSSMWVSCNPRSLMHFLGLRNSPHAQAEIRGYAEAMEAEFATVMPITHAAFLENGRVAP